MGMTINTDNEKALLDEFFGTTSYVEEEEFGKGPDDLPDDGDEDEYGEKAVKLKCAKCGHEYFTDGPDDIGCPKCSEKGLDYYIDSKGIRYVRTPEGAARYGQPIGTPIIADAAGNPIPHSLDGPQSPVPSAGSRKPQESPVVAPMVRGKAGPWSPQIGREVSRYLNYLLIVDREYTDGSTKWRVMAVSSNHQKIIAQGKAKSKEAAKKAAQAAAKRRAKEYQDRPERDFDNLLDYWPGVVGYDYWPDGREVTEAEATKFEEDPEYRAKVAEDHTNSLGIKVVSGYSTQYSRGHETDPFDVNAHETINATLQAFEDMYPGFNENLMNKIGTVDIIGGSGAVAFNARSTEIDSGDAESGFNMKFRTDLMFNADYFGDHDDVYANVEALKRNMSNGWWSGDFDEMSSDYDDMEPWRLVMLNTIVHELGHTFGRVCFGEVFDGRDAADPYRKQPGNPANDVFLDGFWDVLFEWGFLDDRQEIDRDQFARIVRGAKNDMGGDSLTAGFDKALASEVLSTYGATNLHEMLAEVWAEYLLDPQPRQFAIEVGEVMHNSMEAFLAYRAEKGGK